MKTSTSIADKLLHDGVITDGQHQQAVNYMGNFNAHVVDALIDSNVIDEDKLIKWLAQAYKTKFVTTSKLKKAKIGQKVLEKVPLQAAQDLKVFPIVWDATQRVLSVVTSDPSDGPTLDKVQAVAGAKAVHCYVARPAAITAAINKFYKGDIHAFTSIDKESIAAFQSMMNVYERNLVDEGSMMASTATSIGGGSKEVVLSEEELEQKEHNMATGAQLPRGKDALAMDISKIMVSLLESTRENLSGHSVMTANAAEQLCKKMKLPPSEIAAISMAALYHDIGKGGMYHLTAFNVAEWQGHQTNAKKKYQTPVRLFESASLPATTVSCLTHMYEKCDGTGFPDGLKKDEIPLGARIIAIADTYSDLTTNPRNPYRKKLSNEEAISVIKQKEKTVFDANMVDLFAFVMSGDQIKQQLLTGAQTIMVVDPDPEQCAILEMQLTTKGYKVVTSKYADQALKALIKEPVHLILSEVDLKPFDGFDLKKRLNEDDRTRDIPFCYFTASSDGSGAGKAFKLGAEDYLQKSANIEVVTSKIEQYMSKSTAKATKGGVSGSLQEMSIPDLVQILSHGMKTGMLKLVFDDGTKGEVHFVRGQIFNALYERKRGEEAFWAMLKFRQGNFALDPTFEADAMTIQMSSEMLLLEGLRRLDEDNR